MNEAHLPWYRGSKDSRPFILSKMLSSNEPNAPPFHCTAAFPWVSDSMETLWDGSVTDENILSSWKEMVGEFMGAFAVGSTGKMYVFPKHSTGRPFCIRLPNVSWEVQCVAWALSRTAPTDPLIVFTASSLIFILHVKTQKIIGNLRGHGGPITSIAVHPLHPYLFCTTSRDFTTRIYDLTLPPIQTPNNPHWPPSKRPSLAGPAHGLHMSEPEGEGIGRCIIVLVGGLAGGHRGAVFSAAFHRTEPLIATCGMDRAVKIWRIPPYKPEMLSREDKPLFSTDMIHKARVLSINWLSHDILISHSAPALMRRGRKDDLYEENGTIEVWQWLGFNRFFPPGRPIQKVMRGCASDYRNSESFKVLSAYHLPLTTCKLTVYMSPTHDPVVLVPMGKIVRVFNVTQFLPREPPPFPEPLEEQVVALTKRMRLGGDGDKDDDGNGAGASREGNDDATNNDNDDDEEGENVEQGDDNDRRYAPQPSRLKELFDSLEGWDVTLDKVGEQKRSALPDVSACEMAFEGTHILGVGPKSTLYIWQLNVP